MNEAELLYRAADDQVYTVPLQTYPDTTPLVLFDGPLPECVLLRPRSFASFVAAMFWLDALAWRHDCYPELILPFVPGARQDRMNDSGNSLFTARSVAEMLNARNLPRVTVLDPHSDVMPALLERCRVADAAACIDVPPDKYAAVISPDAGAEKRAGAVARKLGVPLVHAWKTRDVATGAISDFDFDARGLRTAHALSHSERVLLVDDICDGGGTFVGLAEAIAADGFALDLHLYTTHGLYTKGVSVLLQHFSHIYCTDAVLGDTAGTIRIPMCEQLLQEGT